MTTISRSGVLPSGTKLQQYLIAQMLGQGAFGITYLAQDERLQRRVAIKEFLPEELAVRGEDHQVRPRSSLHQGNFEHFRDRFLEEARTLARFRHPNLVQVQNYLEENNTAYLVMEYEEGRDMSHYLKEHEGTLTKKQLYSLLSPLLDGLEVLHASGIIHRDIKPANIYIRHDGSPVLLDFGAARQIPAEQDVDRTMTALLTAGYAPMEQYYTDAHQQGPWTDIYALGAVAYRIVTGKRPTEANWRSAEKLRSRTDPLPPAVQLGKGNYPTSLLQAIDRALSILSEDRPRNIANWRKELLAEASESESKQDPPPLRKPSDQEFPKPETEEITVQTGSGPKKPVVPPDPPSEPTQPKVKPSRLALLVLLMAPVMVWLSGLLFQYQDWYFPFGLLSAENNGHFLGVILVMLLVVGYLFYQRHTLTFLVILLGMVICSGSLIYLGWLWLPIMGIS